MIERTMLISLLFWAVATARPATAQQKTDAARGARIWATTCNRCHNARSPLERNDADWGVIVNHMRTVANLTKSQAGDVAVFLRASNNRENTAAVGLSRGDTTSAGIPSYRHERLRSGPSAVPTDTLSEDAVKNLRQLLRLGRP